MYYSAPNLLVEGNYRYGYQGEYPEKDPETGMEAFELRLWDNRIGRWLKTDPYGQYASPFLGMGNDPINGIDKDGGFRTKAGAWLFRLYRGLSGAEIFETENSNITKQKYNLGYTTYDKECQCDTRVVITGADWEDNKLPRIQMLNPSLSLDNITNYVYTREDLRKRQILMCDSNPLNTALRKMEKIGVFDPLGLYDWIDFYGEDVYNNYRFFVGFEMGFSFTSVGADANSLFKFSTPIIFKPNLLPTNSQGIKKVNVSGHWKISKNGKVFWVPPYTRNPPKRQN